MSIAEQVEMQKLAERVAVLEKRFATLVETIATKNGLIPPRDTLHLKDKKRG